MPCAKGDTVYFANMNFTIAGYNYINVYDTNKTLLHACAIASITSVYDTVFDDSGNVIQIKLNSSAIGNDAAYFRVSATLIDSTSIITVNEEIN